MRDLNRGWIRYLPPFIRKRVEGRQYLQNVISNTGWQFVDNILRMGMGLLVGIRVTRYLGPERYGVLSYASAFVFVFSSMAMPWPDWVVVRNIVRDPSRRGEILGTTFVLKLFAGALNLLLALAAIVLLRPAGLLTLMLVGIISLGTVFQAFGTISFRFRSQVQSKYSAYSRSASFLIISPVKIAFIILKAPLVAFAWAAAAGIILGSAGSVIACQVNGHYLKTWRATRSMAKELLRDSWPLMLTRAMVYPKIW